jgi:glycosyltransferase involved in cell wall biosynthesis
MHRVALIASSFHPHTGGVEEHVRHVSRGLAARGHAVEVWTVDRGEHLGTGVVDGVTVRYLPAPLPARNVRALARAAVLMPRAWLAWRRVFRDFRPEVLHVHCFGPNGTYATALHSRTRVPLVVTSHGETFGDAHGIFDRSALSKAALRRALAVADTVTGCSSYVLDDLRARFGLVGGRVVPNGIDLDEVVQDELLDGWPAETGRRVVLSYGRVEGNKGFDLLLGAVAELSADVHVVVGGDGTALPQLRELATTLGITERVHFPGRLSRPQVAGAVAAADVLVVPSRVEAFGIVALEAWRGGAPLVMTSRGGATDFVTDGHDGLLVDPTDIEALAEAIARVLGDPALGARLTTAGRETVRRYTWDRVVTDYAAIYDEVTDAG